MNLVKRKIFDEILEWLDDKRIILIKGARRTGKTTLLDQVRTYLSRRNKPAVLFSADQELDNPVFRNSKLFFRFLSDQYLTDKGKLFCLIDECQYLPDAPVFLKTLHDMAHGKIKLICTGSSSLDLLKAKEPLTGRKVEFVLERFSFSEYLNAASEYRYAHRFRLPEELEPLKEFYEIYRRDLEYHFLQYINWGGYPEVCLEKNPGRKKRYLKEIVATYIEKDVSQFFRVENVSKFNSLARLLCYQRSQILNRSEVSGTLGIHFKTLGNYLNILEGTFIITLVKPYFTNVRKELTKMPKVFINDSGIIRHYTGMDFSDFGSIEGGLIENYAFIHLGRQAYSELFYYRTVAKAEIDFILKQDGSLTPIEVKFRKKLAVPVIMKNFLSNYSKDAEYGVMLSRDVLERKGQVYLLPVVLLDFVTFE